MFSKGRTAAPVDAWHGDSYDRAKVIDSIQIFGASVSFVPQPHDKIVGRAGKLDDVAVRARYLGEAPGSDGHYLLVPRADGKGHVVRTSRDVDPRTWIADLTAPDSMTLADYTLLATDTEPDSPPTAAARGEKEPSEEGSPKIVDIEPDTASGPISVLARTYWQGYQNFAHKRRSNEALIKGKSIKQVEQDIQREWTSLKRSAMIEQDLEAKAHVEDNAELREELLQAVGEPPRKSARIANKSAPASKSGETEIDLSDPNIACQHGKCKLAKQHNCQEKRKHATPSNPIFLCDRCNDAYHAKCLDMKHLPLDEEQFLCRKCRTPGTRIDVFVHSTAQWITGTITKLHHNHNVDVLFQNGDRRYLDLDRTQRWRPHLSSTDKTVASLYVDQTSDPANPTFYVSRVSAIGTPKQYNDILKMQDSGERERWLHATDKEWRSIYEEQQVLKLVERCEVPTNAIIVPSSFIWKMKDDGTYKARLIAIGSRMPSKEVLEIETQAPAPKLPTVRLLLALAAKFDLPAN